MMSERARLNTLISALEVIEELAQDEMDYDRHDLNGILRVIDRRKVRDAMARCRIPDCMLVAEPGELCWFHTSPRDPDLDRPNGHEDRLASYRDGRDLGGEG